MRELICIVCPKGCHLGVDEANDYAVTGNECKRGAAYGKKELTNPTRVITSTVKVLGGELCRCPVKTTGEVPKAKMDEVMRKINRICVAAPIMIGDVLLSNVLDLGVDIVATRGVK